MEVSEAKTLSTFGQGKVLGVNYGNEQILIRPNVTVPEGVMTRRKAVSVLSSFYDPIGIAEEFLLWARLLISATAGVAWGQAIGKQLCGKVQQWARCLNRLDLSFPRRLIANITNSVVYVFCDASAVATGVIVLLQDDQGMWQRYTAKSAVYKKHQRKWNTVSAKIELLALTCAIRMMQILMKVFDKIGVRPEWRLGTDSEVNLTRLHDKGVSQAISDPWQRKVTVLCANGLNNLKVILFHVPGVINPADSVSRGTWQGVDETFNCHQAAASYFDDERAFTPEKLVDSETEAQSRITIDSETEAQSRITIDSENEAQSSKNMIHSVASTRAERVFRNRSESVSLLEKYNSEKAPGECKEEWFRRYQDQDEAISKMKAIRKVSEMNGVWIKKGRQSLDGISLHQMIVPIVLIACILRTFHDCAGHLGARKTLSAMKDTFHWRRMSKDVREYVASCHESQLVKGNRNWLTPPGTLVTDGRVWSVVSCDLVKGDDKILLVSVDMYSRFLFTAELPDETTKSIIHALRKMFLLEGPCKSMVTDNAAVFCSVEFEEFLVSWGIVGRRVPRYSGFYAGWYERAHATIVKTMSILLLENPRKKWHHLLPIVTMCVNNRPYEFTVEGEQDLSPFEVFKGRKREGFFNNTMDVDNPAPNEEQFQENIPVMLQEIDLVRYRFEEIWKSLREKSYSTMEGKIKRVDKLEVGDQVYSWIPKLLQSKYGERWQGPFVVEEVLSNSGTLVLIRGKVEHAYNLKKVNWRGSAVENPTLDARTDPPPRPKRKITDEQGAVSKRVRIAAAMLLDARHPGGELLLL